MRTTGTYLMFERLMLIQELIQNGRFTSKVKLQESIKNRLGVEFSIPTLTRDLDFLRNRADCPIEYDKHQKGYFWKARA